MKSCNTEVKWQGGRPSRLGLLSLLTLMILTLSSGRAVAGVEDFKLWTAKANDRKQTRLENLTSEKDKERATNWFVKTPSEANLAKAFTTETGWNPIQIAQAFYVGLKDASAKPAEAFTAYQKSLSEAFQALKKSEATDWGKTPSGRSRKEGLSTLIEKMLKASQEDLKDREKFGDEEKFLRHLLGGDENLTLREMLELADRLENQAGREDDDKLKEALKRLDERMKELEEKGKASPAPSPAASPAPSTAPSPVPSPIPSPLPSPIPGGNNGGNFTGNPGGNNPGAGQKTGELDDAAMRAEAQKFCDKYNKLREDALANAVNPLKDALAAELARIEAVPKQLENQQRRNDNQFGKLANALGEALGAKQNTPPPQNNQPFMPSQPPPPNNQRESRGGDRNFNQEQEQQPPPPPQPLQFAETPRQAMPFKFKSDIPTFYGKQALLTGRDVLSKIEGEPSLAESLNKNSSLEDLFFAQAKARSRAKKLTVVARNMRSEAATIRSAIVEKFAKSTEGALDEAELERLERLPTEIQRMRSELEGVKKQATEQSKMMEQNDPNRQALSQMVDQKQAQLAAKEAELEEGQRLKAKAMKAAGADVQMMAQRMQQLETEAGEVENKRDEVKQEEQVISQIVKTNQDMQLRMLEQNQAPQAQPPQSRNVYDAVRSSGAGRGAMKPSMSGAMRSPKSTATQAGEGAIRGSLGAISNK